MPNNQSSDRKLDVSRSYTGQDGFHNITDIKFGFFYSNPLYPNREICYYWKLSDQLTRGNRHFLVESLDKTEIIIEHKEKKFIKIEFPHSLLKNQWKSPEESPVSYYELDGCPTFSLADFKAKAKKINLNISEAASNFTLDKIDDILLQTYLARSTVVRVVKKSHMRTERIDAMPWKEVDFKHCQPFLTEQKLRNSKIPFETQFRILCCLTQLTVDLFFFTEKMFKILETKLMNGKRLDPSLVDRVLEDFILPDVKLQSKPPSCYNFQEVFCEKYKKEEEFSSLSLPRNNTEITQIKSAIITPSIIVYSFKKLNPGNSVVRRYPDKNDRFLIAKFQGEDGKPLYISHTNILQDKFKAKIQCLQILSRKFELLAYSASQLKKASFWMLNQTPDFTIEIYKRDVGDLSQQKNPAKFGARLGQLLSDSKQGLDMIKSRVRYEQIPDLESPKEQGEGNYIYSDGIGKISANLVHKIQSNLHLDGDESAFQVRIGGVKGVLVMDIDLPDNIIQVRSSMMKFKYSSFAEKLDVLHWNEYQPACINAQIALLFLTRGIDPHVLFDLQKFHLKALKKRIIPEERADYGKNSERPLQFIQKMQKAGMMTRKKKDFFAYGVSQVLRYKYFIHQETSLKQRIYIPVKKAAYLIGIIDEHGVLGPGEVFVSISPSDGKKRDKKVIRGRITVTKNPCLHPGDLQDLTAVNTKQVRQTLGHFVNCIVFPFNKGERPHFNKMAGADLDGDKFFVTWDPRLILKQKFKPACYEPRQEKVQDISDQAIRDFMCEAILNFNLHRIANSHLAKADKSPELANSPECIRLSEHHSQEVDYPKTGNKAKVKDEDFANEYPHFMEKEESKTYKSTSPLGKLYDMAKEALESLKPIPQVKTIKSRIEKCFIVRGYKNYLPECFKIKESYIADLKKIKDKYNLQTEFEIFAAINLTDRDKYTKETLKKQEELIDIECQQLRHRYYARFHYNVNPDNLLQKISALYFACYYRKSGPGQYKLPTIKPSLLELESVGLPWLIVQDKLFEIKARYFAKERFSKSRNQKYST